MNRIFIYDKNIDLGFGTFARVDGYKLTVVPHTFSNSFEAVRSNKKSIYGTVYTVDDDILESLDIFYGVSVGLHNRITTPAYLDGGAKVEVLFYEMADLQVQE